MLNFNFMTRHHVVLDLPAYLGNDEFSYKHPRWWMRESELNILYDSETVSLIVESRTEYEREVIERSHYEQDIDNRQQDDDVGGYGVSGSDNH